MSEIKLFYVSGVRHHAVVLAKDNEEASKLALAASEGNKDERVLFGFVGDWESPEFYELKLPENYRIERG